MSAGPLTLVAIGGVLLVSFLEISARLRPSLLPRDLRIHRAKQLFSTQLTAPDPELGYALKAPYRRELRWGTLDLSARHIPFPGQNDFGYRAAAGSRLENSDVVVLGDSLAYAAEVDEKDAWPSRLGRLGNLTVANLGVSGYGSSQMLGLFKRFAASFRPRLVIALIHADAPVKDYYLRSWTERRAAGLLSPWESRFGNYLLYQELGLPAPVFKMTKTLWQRSLFFKITLPFMAMASCSSRARAAALAQGMPILQKNVIEMRDRVRGSGGTLLVVLEPSWRHANGAAAMEFSRSLTAAGIRFLDLEPLFERNSARRLRVAFDPHWNEIGHKLAAEEVYRALERQGMLAIPAGSPRRQR